MSVKSESSAMKPVTKRAQAKAVRSRHAPHDEPIVSRSVSQRSAHHAERDDYRPDRAFDPVIWSEAERLTRQYQVVLHCEEDHWYGRGLELPKVFADGATANECVAETRNAMQGVVAFLIESGKSPPAPANEGARKQQVNVRLTAEERLLFESAARRKGFAGLSDFFRSAASVDAAR
jgi:predicted RNase H-like HicB family nuclease